MTRQWLRAHVERVGDCWLWPNDSMYRKVYTALVGTIVPGCHVHHVCGMRRCVRPSHLKQYSKAGHRRQHWPIRHAGPDDKRRNRDSEDLRAAMQRERSASYSPQFNGVVHARDDEEQW